MARKNGFRIFDRSITCANVYSEKDSYRENYEPYFKDMYNKGFLSSDKSSLEKLFIMFYISPSSYIKILPFYCSFTPQGYKHWHDKRKYSDLTSEDMRFIREYYEYVKIRLQAT